MMPSGRAEGTVNENAAGGRDTHIVDVSATRQEALDLVRHDDLNLLPPLEWASISKLS